MEDSATRWFGEARDLGTPKVGAWLEGEVGTPPEASPIVHDRAPRRHGFSDCRVRRDWGLAIEIPVTRNTKSPEVPSPTASCHRVTKPSAGPVESWVGRPTRPLRTAKVLGRQTIIGFRYFSPFLSVPKLVGSSLALCAANISTIAG